jgi:hypothetical protein
MTLAMLKQVDWVQVLTDVAITVGVVLVAVGGEYWSSLSASRKPFWQHFY